MLETHQILHMYQKWQNLISDMDLGLECGKMAQGRPLENFS